MYGYHSANKFKVRTLTIDISGVGKVVSDISVLSR